MRRRLSKRMFLAAALPLLAPAIGLAAPPALQEGGDKPAEEAKAEGKKEGEKKKEEEEKEEWLAVIGGDVFTGTGARLRGATVLAKNGRIEEIGHEIDVPEGATVIDAAGLRVYPGLVAVGTTGLLGTTGSDFQDSFDPYSSRMVMALGSGITTAAQGASAVKLRRGEVKDVVLREKFQVPLVFSTANPSSKRNLVEKLDAAAKYLREYREWEEKKKDDKDLKEPPKKGVDSSVLSVLEGKTLAKFNADERRDLLEIAQVARKYGFRPLIEGCREGWTVAEELGRAGAFAIVTPRERRDKSEELVRPGGSSIENAAILHAHGVQVAVIPASTGVDLGGIAGRDILHLPIEAGFAVRGGLSEKAALEAITVVPARVLGVDHRIGTLEVGKDCDLVVTDGDILHYQTFVQYAVVSGKQVYDKQKELFYAHIRPRPSTELAPEKRVDPGEEEAATAKPPEEKPPEEKPKDGEKPPPPTPPEEKKPGE